MASSAREYIDKDMNFNAINRLRLEYFDETEVLDKGPFQEDASEQLAFPAGLIWWSVGRGTVRVTYEAYAGDPSPGPGIHSLARHLEVAASGTSPMSISHNLNCYPNVQFMEQTAKTLMTPTTLTWTNLNTVTVTFTGTWSVIAIFSG